MKRLWMSGAAAVMAISMAGLGAQTPQTQPPATQTPTTQAPASASTAQTATTTIQGCVYKEEAIPGRAPNIAEKAGVLEDYILVPTDTSLATAGTSGTTPPAAAGTTGTAAAKTIHKAFKLEKISDDQLRAVVGKRVEITGRVDAEKGDTKAAATGTSGTGTAPAADKTVGPDSIELPEFEVTSMREVEGTCPATPNIKK